MKIYEQDFMYLRTVLENQLKVEEEKEQTEYNRGVVDALKWLLECPLSPEGM